MNSDRLKEILEKIPAGLLLVAYLGYLGWDYYSFMHDEASPLIMKQKEIEAAKSENQKLQVKVREGEAFLKSLDAKRSELRRLAGELDSMKGTLSESLDLPDFMKTTLTEAKRVGLTVIGLKPGTATQKEYYAEQPFEFSFRGVYVQLMIFLDHMANVQKIVRVDNFDIKPHSSASAKYVELEGTVQIKAYRYVASKADSLGREPAPSTAPTGKPGDSGSPGGSGTGTPPKGKKGDG